MGSGRLWLRSATDTGRWAQTTAPCGTIPESDRIVNTPKLERITGCTPGQPASTLKYFEPLTMNMGPCSGWTAGNPKNRCKPYPWYVLPLARYYAGMF